MKFKKRKYTAIIVALSMITVGSSIYAADYRYDDLNRVTSVEKEGRTTNYVYDQAGNLLSATSSANTTEVSAQRSFAPSDDVVEGWTAYKTTGMTARYETAIVNNDTSLATAVQRLSLNSDRTGGANVYRDMAVQAGVSYTYRGQVKSEQMRDAVIQVVVNYYDAQQRLIRHDNVINMKQDSDWKDYNKNLIAPADSVTARLHLQVVLLKANGQATAEFADQTFEQVASQGGQ